MKNLKKEAESQKVSKSIIQPIGSSKMCYVCQTSYNLHKHHIFYGTANRKKAEQDGCWCWLCSRHHNMSNDGVHFNKQLDLELKTKAQLAWMQVYNKTINDFIKRYGKNYL